MQHKTWNEETVCPGNKSDGTMNVQVVLLQQATSKNHPSFSAFSGM